MNTQLAGARWTIALYSRAYFASAWCTAEWTAALARRTLLPVRLEPVEPPATLQVLTWVDLFDLDENQARERLLYAVGKQVLPRLAAFPGRTSASTATPVFPGATGAVGHLHNGVERSDPAVTLATALSQLGSTTLAVRCAGIRAMERAATAESADPALIDEVAEVLESFLRGTRNAKGARPGAVAPEDLLATGRILVRIAKNRSFDLSDAWLNGADLTGGHFAGARLAGAILANVRLVGADLTGADLTDARLDAVDFTGANLAGARLDGSILTVAGLTDADLTNALLTGTRFIGAQGLTQEQLESAEGDAVTQLPRGLVRPVSWRA
ncbi:pentapeptide repeat protein [Candidatus Protofrankia datiscae]|uniref:Pentapeptide repeat protein n=2 Tax=Frankiaceae TaxID=74712 RepID=F8AY21_9ACTN|nr:pentapeptide repeat protein [Candidatus Protofrankia datiscae]